MTPDVILGFLRLIFDFFLPHLPIETIQRELSEAAIRRAKHLKELADQDKFGSP